MGGPREKNVTSAIKIKPNESLNFLFFSVVQKICFVSYCSSRGERATHGRRFFLSKMSLCVLFKQI